MRPDLRPDLRTRQRSSGLRSSGLSWGLWCLALLHGPSLQAAAPAKAPAAPAAPQVAVPADKARGTLRLSFLSESGYLDEQQAYKVDVLERDMAYMTLRIETADGRPVVGARPSFEVSGSSRVMATTNSELTDAYGMYEFAIIGGSMGTDRITARYKDQSLQVQANVISLKASGYAGLDDVEGVLRWDLLMQARLRFDDTAVRAEFPPDVAAHNGKTVRLIGFMMPLDADKKQRHFLLTSNPPSCFFHIPGGPAGAVEVQADKGIVASWDPVMLEGRLETVTQSPMGVVYRLHQAREVPR